MGHVQVETELDTHDRGCSARSGSSLPSTSASVAAVASSPSWGFVNTFGSPLLKNSPPHLPPTKNLPPSPPPAQQPLALARVGRGSLHATCCQAFLGHSRPLSPLCP